MVSKHVCGYEQKLTRIYDYGYTYDKRGNLVKEEEICSPTTTGPKNITVATYLYDETNRMVQGTNKAGEVSAYTFNGLGVRVGTELILKDNTHGYTDFHCQTPSVETGIEKPEVVKTDYVIDYTRLDIDQRVLMKSEQDGYDFFYTYGLDKLQVMTIGEGSNWWGQSIKKCVNMAYVHTDRLGSVVNLSDQYGRVTARVDYTDWGEVRRYTDITVDGGFRRLLPEITYATHEYDDVLNQFYAKARMYDAENKRFDAVDPILDPAGYDINSYATDPMQLVQYLYVKDNPVNRIDPLGEIDYLTQGTIFLSGVVDYLSDTLGCVLDITEHPVRTAINVIKGVYNIGKKVLTGQLSMPELLKTFGNGLTEALVGDIFYVVKYFDQFSCKTKITDEQARELGRRTMGAIVQATVLVAAAAKLASKVPAAVEKIKNVFSINAPQSMVDDAARALAPTMGRWKPVNESMSEISRNYQAAITGHTGEVWFYNGVKFDGFSNGTLIEAKAHYSQFVSKSGTFKEWFSGANGFVDQARRQLAAANGTPITWYFQEESVRNATEILFKQNGIKGINLVFKP